jgi:glycosyltransferase involved in cell wall biosynthesis
VMTVHEYPPFYNGLGALMLRKQTRLPIALEIHHLVGIPKAASLQEWIGARMSRFVLPREMKSVQAVRTVNDEVKRRLVSWGVDPSIIRVVPSFYLDSSVLRPDARIEKKYDVAFCARLVANKGVLAVIEAVASIPGCTLLVIGDGPLKIKAEALVTRLNAADRVTFAGWVPGVAPLADAMLSAKTFVMHSTSEGGPRVALEAMALGLPVIATRVGVMPDVIRDGENGMFVDGSVDDLARKLRLLIADASLRERLGHEAGRVIERFEKKTAIKAYADFLKSLS